MRKWFRHPEVRGYLIAAGCIVISTMVFLPGREYFAKGQWALLYLLLISLVAGMSGVRAAVLTSILAFLAWDFFFLPPYYTLWIADPKDWLALLIFLGVGVGMGVQTGRIRDRESRAIARERETALLNDVSAVLVSITGTREMAEMLLHEIAHFTGAAAVVLWLPDAAGQLAPIYHHPSASATPDPQAAECAGWVFQTSKAIGLPGAPPQAGTRATRWPISAPIDTVISGSACRDIFLPLQTALSIEGVLQIESPASGQPYSIHELRVLVSMANLASSYLENQHLQFEAMQAVALQEADRLKTTLVSSVSHELKTPLAALQATVTNLLADDVDWTVPRMREELAYTGVNLDRLHDSINALLDFARLESADWKFQFDWYELDDILGIVRERLSEAECARITLAVGESFPPLYIDCQQMARAIQHLVENALVYAPPDSPITIGGRATPNESCLWIEDRGPGIPMEERERIFEKFYRGSTSNRFAQGTGLGLAIAAEIVRLHHGRLWVEEVQPRGARFVIALPQHPYR